ncbi:hypothetical protein BGZ76_002784 [Entomortierella beljakovae]|nr:hypothetical protein BGZ76_002784 [Entomortierella beljakovae]
MAYITIAFDNFLEFKNYLSPAARTSALFVKTALKVNRADVFARRVSNMPSSEDISAWVPYGGNLCDLPLTGFYSLDDDYIEYHLGEPEREFFLLS